MYICRWHPKCHNPVSPQTTRTENSERWHVCMFRAHLSANCDVYIQCFGFFKCLWLMSVSLDMNQRSNNKCTNVRGMASLVTPTDERRRYTSGPNCLSQFIGYIRAYISFKNNSLMLVRHLLFRDILSVLHHGLVSHFRIIDSKIWVRLGHSSWCHV